MMRTGKKIIVISGILVFTAAGIAGIKPPEEETKYKNLKVLDKKIDEDQMERVMFNFDKQLGVTCQYCHVSAKDVFPPRADFASDEKKEKLVAREMLRMTLRLNKKYFDLEIDRQVRIKPLVWCRTCHMGLSVPRDK